MANPIPGRSVSTPYGKRGTHWSCREDSSGRGIHTGIDIAAPNGTKIYAPIAGQIRHRSYGSAFGGHQFAISPDADQSFGNGEVFFAHCRKRLADGTRVQVGDYIGEVGSEGNVTGPHLHMEYMPSTKGKWNCSVHADPKPVLDHKAGGTSSPGGDSDGGPYITKDIYTNKLGYGEPTNGDDSSDTVKELQERLNRIKLTGGKNLPVTGKYADMTDAEVRKWQEQIVADTPDPEKKSYLGPAQTKAMFPSPPYTIHDRGLPQIATGTAPEPEPGPDPTPPPSTGTGTTLGTWLADQGFIVEDSDVPLGRDSAWDRVKFIVVHHTASADGGSEADIASYVRTGGEYPPLSQIMLGQSGTVWMCSRERAGQASPGRASHAGSGAGYGIAVDTMNQVSLGIECQAAGNKPLRDYPVLYDTLINLIAVLCERFDVPVANVIGHKEWSNTGKVDPLDNMDLLRDDVADILSQSPPPQPPPDPEPETPVTPVPIDSLFQYHYSGKPSGEQAVGTSYTVVDKSAYTPPGDGILLSMLYLNAKHTFDSGVNEAGFRVRAARAAHKGQEVDYSGYGDFTPNRNITQAGVFLLTHIWFEKCEGGRKVHWEVDRASEFKSFSLGTRYTKWMWISKEVFALLARLAGGEAKARKILEQWLEEADEENTITF